MGLFEVPERTNKARDKAIAGKSKSKSKVVTTKGGNDLLGRIKQIQDLVEKRLGKFADDYIIINTEEELKRYLSIAKENNQISIDTETTGLDPLLDKCVGICIFTSLQDIFP